MQRVPREYVPVNARVCDVLRVPRTPVGTAPTRRRYLREAQFALFSSRSAASMSAYVLKPSLGVTSSSHCAAERRWCHSLSSGGGRSLFAADSGKIDSTSETKAYTAGGATAGRHSQYGRK